MRIKSDLACTLLLGLCGTAAAQTAAPTPAEPAASAPAAETAAEAERIVIFGQSVGMRQTRANVKITGPQLDVYPPGTSADKLLERVSGIQLGSSNAFGGDGFESTINMRGFGKDSIGFSIDGIPNGRTTLGGGSVPTRFFDTSNLQAVDVSQSAGVVGSPSRQALVGHVNYLTQDPDADFGIRGEAAAGSADYRRLYARVDSGELAAGLTSYLSVSKQESVVSYVDDPSGKNTREHVDLKLVGKFGNGAVLKLRSGYNNRKETSGTNIVTLAQFNTDPTNDGYTDRWTGDPAVDRNYRGFKGNPRKDHLTYLDLSYPLSGGLKLSAKTYYHTQEGIGKEASLGDSGFPGLDGEATSLYFRANQYRMHRFGLLSELTGQTSELLNWKVGAWWERYKRSQKRDWYPVLDEAVGPAADDTSDATSEDKRWRNAVTMLYAANRSRLLGGRLNIDYGLSYLANQVGYDAPIQDSRDGEFNYVNEADVSSGVLPKAGVVYALRDDLEVFAGYAKNAASVTDATLEGGAAPTLAEATTVTRMDKADAFDFGLRHKGDNYAIGLQGFFIKSKETVAADIAGTLQSENVDQGRRIKGIEFSVNGKFGDLSVYGSYTVQRHRYDLSNVDAAGYPERGFIRDGADLVGIANQNLFLEALWRPGDHFKAGINVRHLSDRAGYYANPRIDNSGVDERLPAYTLLGLSASYRWDSIQVGMNIENLTDKAYVSGIAPELLTTPSFVGRYFIGAPRSVLLWVKAEL